MRVVRGFAYEYVDEIPGGVKVAEEEDLRVELRLNGRGDRALLFAECPDGWRACDREEYDHPLNRLFWSPEYARVLFVPEDPWAERVFVLRHSGWRPRRTGTPGAGPGILSLDAARDAYGPADSWPATTNSPWVLELSVSELTSYRKSEHPSGPEYDPATFVTPARAARALELAEQVRRSSAEYLALVGELVSASRDGTSAFERSPDELRADLELRRDRHAELYAGLRRRGAWELAREKFGDRPMCVALVRRVSSEHHYHRSTRTSARGTSTCHPDAGTAVAWRANAWTCLVRSVCTWSSRRQIRTHTGSSRTWSAPR